MIPQQNYYEHTVPKRPRRSGRNCCLIFAITLSVVIVLVGGAIYIALTLTSDCYTGCNSLCERSCVSRCWRTCWKGHWAYCPDDGPDVCTALEAHHYEPENRPGDQWYNPFEDRLPNSHG